MKRHFCLIFALLLCCLTCAVGCERAKVFSAFKEAAAFDEKASSQLETLAFDDVSALAEMRQILETLTANLQSVDTSACPQKYRDAHDNLVAKTREITNLLRDAESRDWFADEPEEATPFQSRLDAAGREYEAAASRLNDTARSYGIKVVDP